MAPTNVPKGRAVRRQLPRAEKRRLVEAMLRSGASVDAFARKHGLNPNSVYRWKRLYGVGSFDAQAKSSSQAASGAASASFLPVTLVPTVRSPQPTAQHVTLPSGGGIMHLAFASGATLRIETGVLDAALVCAIVGEMRR